MRPTTRCSLVMILGCGMTALTGCHREAAQAESTAKEGYRNACDLLTVEEVSAAAGVAVTAREMSDADGTDQDATDANRMAERSACSWEGPDGQAFLIVKGYWTEGKKWWEINAMSRGMAKSMIQNQEGVALDSVVKAGPVYGLGDKAFFSPLFGSLVLKDDIMLEITTIPTLRNPEVHFRPLVTKMLARL